MSLEIELRAMLRDVVREVVREEIGTKPATPLQAELLTYKAAAKAHSVSVSTLKRWVRAGTLASTGKGKLRRVRSADVLAALTGESTSSTPAPRKSVEASVTSILASLPRRAR